MSDNLSDMKATKAKPRRKAAEPLPDTFNVRDMSRNSALLLRASIAHGQVRIESRTGAAFLLRPVTPEEAAKGRVVGDFAARQRTYREKLRQMGCRPPATREELQRINRVIAGEE